MHTKKIHIFGGGTINPVRPHLALCAPAFGTTARRLAEMYEEMAPEMEVVLHLTRMADPDSKMVTNSDVENVVADVIEDPATQIVIFSTAMTDFTGHIRNGDDQEERLSSRQVYKMTLAPAPKVIRLIRAERKDIFLAGFKTTAGENPAVQFHKGLRLMKTSHCNLVLANDIQTRNNMIITPEEARYHETTDREEVLKGLVEMSLLRSHLTFTRSTVVDAKPVPWHDDLVPPNLRKVVDYCINRNAYKPGPTGATVGHFACKIGETTFLTSRRKVDFNKMAEVGLVKVETDGPDTVIAYGSKPSVGGQSQRIVFDEHEGYNCIVHFHCPLKPNAPDMVPIVSQREYECGSHQCGQNTSNGLLEVGDGIKAVMLDKHGPNIVFKPSTPAKDVIRFIDRNFDLGKKTT